MDLEEEHSQLGSAGCARMVRVRSIHWRHTPWSDGWIIEGQVHGATMYCMQDGAW